MKAWKRTAIGAVNVTAGLALTDRLITQKAPLPPPVDAEPRTLSTRDGRVTYYEAGTGRMVLLLHSFNAAGTSYELRPVFEALSRSRHVIAMDWLGFGLSDRPAKRFTAGLYERQLRNLLDMLATDAVDVVALSLPGQYVVKEAAAQPRRFRRLVVISPPKLHDAGPVVRAGGEAFAGFVRTPVYGQALYNLIRSKPSIRYFERDMFADPGLVPAGYERYGWNTAHQPRARYAPASFLGGLLWPSGVEEAFARLETPTLLLFGDHPRFSDPEGMRSVAAMNRHIRVEVLRDCGDLPQFEQPRPALEAITTFLDGGRVDTSPAGERATV